MLASVTLKKYQSHLDTTLHLHPGVNVILGSSMAGKTAIIRAVRNIAENRPLGLKRRSQFAKPGEPFEIMVKTTEGIEIALTKNEKGAVYRVGTEEFSGFEASIPAEVTQALRLTDLNIQKQLEPFFFICSSPPEVAREINQIMRIERVDDWVSELTSRLNSVNKESSLLSDQIKQHKTELGKIPDLLQLEKDVAEADKIERELVVSSDKLLALGYLYSELAKAELGVSRYGEQLKAETLVAQTESYIKRLEALGQKERLLTELQDAQRLIEKEAEFVDYCAPLIEESEKTVAEIQLLGRQESKLLELHRNLVTALNLQSKYKQQTEMVSKQLVDFMKRIGKCPLCLSALTDAKVKELVERV